MKPRSRAPSPSHKGLDPRRPRVGDHGRGDFWSPSIRTLLDGSSAANAPALLSPFAPPFLCPANGRLVAPRLPVGVRVSAASLAGHALGQRRHLHSGGPHGVCVMESELLSALPPRAVRESRAVLPDAEEAPRRLQTGPQHRGPALPARCLRRVLQHRRPHQAIGRRTPGAACQGRKKARPSSKPSKSRRTAGSTRTGGTSPWATGAPSTAWA